MCLGTLIMRILGKKIREPSKGKSGIEVAGTRRNTSKMKEMDMRYR